MRTRLEWGFLLLMLGFTVLGAAIATAAARMHFEAELHAQQVHFELEIVKKHMTTMLQLNDCYINEAFYTLDRDIFQTKQQFERTDLPTSLSKHYQIANKWILDYYARFDLKSTCDNCVPRSPMPIFNCTAA